MSRASKIGAVFLLALLIVSVVVSATLIYFYTNLYRQILQEALAEAQTQASTAALEISDPFAELMAIAERIADDLSDGTLAYTDIEQRMVEIIEDRPDIDGLAITFEPFAYNPDVRLFQTYVYRVPDGSYDVLRGATYNYTMAPELSENGTAWYVNTIEQGAQWHEPFFATGAQDILVEYGVPFYPVGADPQTANPAGIVSIDYTLQTVRDLIRDLDLGDTGYGFVLSGQGTFLAHPISDFIVNRTFFEVSGDDEALRAAARSAVEDRSPDMLETIDPFTESRTWYFFEPIGPTGWTVGVVMTQDQFRRDSRQVMRDQMTVAISVATTLFFLAAAAFHLDRYRFTDFWWMSDVFSILAVVLIVMAWTLTNRVERREGVRINSPTELDRYLEGIETSVIQDGRTEQIPTGVFITALQFPEPTSVTLNGYIWQRYDVDSRQERGFALPQRIGEEATIEEVQREVVGGYEYITWYVGVTLRQTYDATRFPFDHRNIVLRINPLDLDENVILTPDLESYELLNARLRPGVDPQASINNWTLLTSGYSYTTQRLNTNLGVPSRALNDQIHEMRFELQVRRNYLGPFIAYLLPALIAAVMTFAYLLSGRQPGNSDEIVSVLNYAAALFFVIAIIHTALRDQIAAVGITYMEYLYILLYVLLISVAANIFMVARFPQWGIVRYKNNLIPKVMYWPVFAGGMLVATLLIFVY
ncbi:MAG: Cache 3/Cache 2 fusion domain-containing protein [Chloroflexota bacterium]